MATVLCQALGQQPGRGRQGSQWSRPWVFGDLLCEGVLCRSLAKESERFGSMQISGTYFCQVLHLRLHLRLPWLHIWGTGLPAWTDFICPTPPPKPRSLSVVTRTFF